MPNRAPVLIGASDLIDPFDAKDAARLAATLDSIPDFTPAARDLGARDHGTPDHRTAEHGTPDLAAAVRWCVNVGRWAPRPGAGQTVRLWELLASVAATDLGAARMLEPHLDALAILSQHTPPIALDAIGAGPESSWGVYAAEGGDEPLTASAAGALDSASPAEWVLDGVKPWCSLARDLSHALVTAHTGEGTRGLFAVNLRDRGVDAAPGPWVARGLAQIVSASVRFDRVPAVRVGPDQWYLERPGFAWGGIGVAAVWWGGSVGVARQLFDALASRRSDLLLEAHLGAVDASLAGVRATLAEAASLIDKGCLDAAATNLLEKRIRILAAGVAESVLMHAAHALGPAPLTVDEGFARRVADLELYVRQHHAERDDAALGRALVSGGRAPW